MRKKDTVIALIPARAGSQRVVDKNIKELNGHPLLAYTISAAKQSGVFSRVIVSTDSEEIASIARQYGAEIPFLRPAEFATGSSPDIDWIIHLLKELNSTGELENCFSILRPTSPFRLPKTIRMAWRQFQEHATADSLRAVEKCAQHPAKMWMLERNLMQTVMKNPDQEAVPWHSMPYHSLPVVYVQNASLEIAYCDVPLEMNTIAGNKIMPFITEGYEGFDINLPEDWFLAEYLIQNGRAQLPEIVN